MGASRGLVWCLAFALLGGASLGGRPAAADVGAGTSPRVAVGTAETLVLPPLARTMPRSWPESFAIRYGDAPGELGREWYSDGMERVDAESGAKAPDGSWWILDTAKYRFARYSSTGDYLGQVLLPRRPDQPWQSSRDELPYRAPRVLGDGTVVAFAGGEATTSILRVRDGVPDILSVPGQLRIVADDGQRLYGHDWLRPTGPTFQTVVVDPRTGAVSDAAWFRKQDGTRYRVSITDGTRLRVQLPDATPPADRTWTLTAAGGGPVRAGLAEIATGADGTLHLLIHGTAGSGDDARTVNGYLPVAADGTAGEVEPSSVFELAWPIVAPLLGVAYGTTAPWAIWPFGEDSLTVWERVVPAPRGLERACPADLVPAHGFVDVLPVDTHGAAIACVRWQGLTRGTTSETFAPTRPVTRAQAASFLLRLIERTEFDLSEVELHRFPDTAGNVHEPAISRLAGAGLLVGRNGRFEPDAPVTRGQFATLLVRTLELLRHELDHPLPGEPADHFTDDDGSIHGSAIDRAAAAGLVAGVGPYRYRPAGTISRAQVASLLVRSLDLFIEGGAAAPPGAGSPTAP